MSTTLDEMDSPYSFLSRLLIPQNKRRAIAHETVELSKITGDRQVAGFVRRGGPAQSLEGYEKVFQSLTCPLIKVKRPVNAWDHAFERFPGMGVFPSDSEMRAARRKHIATELAILEDSIVNTEEWMAAQALRGVISWSVEDEEHFSVDYAKPNSHETSVAVTWATTSTDPSVDFRAAKRLINAAHPGLPVTHAIMDRAAADRFMALTVVKTQLDTANFKAGSLTIEEQYKESGVIYLGRYAGVDCWEYNASLDINGVATPLIRTDYVEFISARPTNGLEMIYGAIPDEEIAQGGKFVGRRYAKQWVDREAGVRTLMAQSRPVIANRKPGFVVSMDTAP